jgi:hypothetical protein|tara:strand:+ start:14741 stop:16321 length:1581 start_codon:yes stop_codon:yes gene_type:complete
MTGLGRQASEGSQDAVVAFLSSPRTYGGRAPEHVTTHISHIFLTERRAYKLKRALKLPFVDYRDVQDRRAFCRREVAINRHAAPSLYLGVIPVTCEANGRLALDGDGQPVDWLVEMRRFDRNMQFDVMLDGGRLTEGILNRTGDRIAALHMDAAIVRVHNAARDFREILRNLAADIFANVETGQVRDCQGWASAAMQSCARQAFLLDRRGRHGFVRFCHGDLHLSNICLWDGVPTPFDAVEFRDDLARIDVAYDLAFLLADLELRGHRGKAQLLLSRYLSATRDYAGLTLIPLFMSARAMVRALTSAMKGHSTAHHIEWASEMLASRKRARLIAIGGLSGTGKTTLARELLTLPRTITISSDVVRKRMFHELPERVLGEAAYTAAVNCAVYRRLRRDCARALRAGWNVIVDATFTDAGERAAIQRLAKDAAADFSGFWLQGDEATLSARLAARPKGPSDADRPVLKRQIESGTGPINWHVLNASAPVLDVLSEVQLRLCEEARGHGVGGAKTRCPRELADEANQTE